VPLFEALIAFTLPKRDNQSMGMVRSAGSAIDTMRHGAYDDLLEPIDL
jgi:hypothetical protein